MYKDVWTNGQAPTSQNNCRSCNEIHYLLSLFVICCFLHFIQGKVHKKEENNLTNVSLCACVFVQYMGGRKNVGFCF